MYCVKDSVGGFNFHGYEESTEEPRKDGEVKLSPENMSAQKEETTFQIIKLKITGT